MAPVVAVTMNFRLLSLAFAPFAFGTSAFAFVGLLEPMAEGLAVSLPVAGQLQAVFAVACGLGGPLLARALSRLDRKRVLLAVMSLLFAMNVISGLATDFDTIAITRIIGGLFAALTLPLTSTIAINLVPEIERPKAIATVLSGYTLAFLLGMPIATLLGDAFGWRAAFWFAAAITVLAFAMIFVGAPGKTDAAHLPNASFRGALSGNNRRLMLVTFLGFAATFMTVSFIGPVITAFSGVTGAAVGGVQIATGFGSLIGLPAGAMLAKLPVRTALAILMVVTAITQALFTVGMKIDLASFALPLLVITMALGSASLFACSPVIQTQLAINARDSTTIAFALNGSMLYFGQGVGAAGGGAIIAEVGLAWTGIGGAVAAVIALLIVAMMRPAGSKLAAKPQAA